MGVAYMQKVLSIITLLVLDPLILCRKGFKACRKTNMESFV